MLLMVSLLAAFTPAAKAAITCNSWKAGSYSGNNVYNCNFSSGNTGGTYNNSYVCGISQLLYGFCTLNYKGGVNSYSGPCTIVFKCYNGQSYYCDINDWDGKEIINCRYIPSGCKEIDICTPTNPTTTPKSGGPSPSVPEPSTVIAAVLLLIPFGISTARILRKQKALAKN